MRKYEMIEEIILTNGLEVEFCIWAEKHLETLPYKKILKIYRGVK